MRICIIVCTVTTSVDVTFPEYYLSIQCGFRPQTAKLSVGISHILSSAHIQK